MRAEVTPHTLQEIADNYESAVAWVESVGFPVDRGRIVDYREILRTLSFDFERGGWGDLDDPEQREKVCTTLLEVRELTSIHRGLRQLDEASAVTGLKHYLKGPFLLTDESSHNSSNRPRNLGFELYLKVLFAFAELRPTYETTADLCFDYMGKKFFVEAKRPMSATTAESAINDANKQLSQRLDGFHGQDTRGLIAVDLSKIINPENKVMPVSGEDHLYELMYNEDRRQIELLRSAWHHRRHSRTIGIILHYRMLTNFRPTGALNTLKWVAFVQLQDDPALLGLNQKLQAVIRKVC